MSCSAGHGSSFFTDAPACYAGPDLRLRQCICPITTCTATAYGYSCQLTSEVIALCGLLLAIWIIASCAYVYVSNYIGVLELESRNLREVSLSRNYYYNKLFGRGSDQNSPTTSVGITEEKRL